MGYLPLSAALTEVEAAASATVAAMIDKRNAWCEMCDLNCMNDY